MINHFYAQYSFQAGESTGVIFLSDLYWEHSNDNYSFTLSKRKPSTRMSYYYQQQHQQSSL